MTLVQTSTGTDTPLSATLISRYGMPQMTPIAANKSAPRLLNRHLPSAGKFPTRPKAAATANIPD